MCMIAGVHDSACAQYEWQNGRIEEWQDGRMEEWKNGRMEWPFSATVPAVVSARTVDLTSLRMHRGARGAYSVIA